MPIYEYECTKCGNQTEVWQKFSDPPNARCELCKGKMKKLISQSTFHLKGSGWYVTDYASKDASRRGEYKEKSEKSEKNTPSKEAKGSTDSSKKESSSSSSDKKKQDP
ncbi:MAG: zinc ribbon domain-containing protein [Deltaproteobacteria bacterium]|nr:zinc ribbon domain-containing protein [Deltaproteobacteria bacterium]MBL7175008.1 zinc ribbon domain-containing protein [Desulfobacteraceae bacterium]